MGQIRLPRESWIMKPRNGTVRASHDTHWKWANAASQTVTTGKLIWISWGLVLKYWLLQRKLFFFWNLSFQKQHQDSGVSKQAVVSPSQSHIPRVNVLNVSKIIKSFWNPMGFPKQKKGGPLVTRVFNVSTFTTTDHLSGSGRRVSLSCTNGLLCLMGDCIM